MAHPIPSSDNILFYNSTIRNDGFFIELIDQNSCIGYKHIHGLYRYVYNRVYDELLGLGLIDYYGRPKVSISTMIGCLKDRYDLNPGELYCDDNPISIARLFHQVFIENGGMQLAEWTKVYPLSIVTQAFVMCARDLITRPRLILKKLKEKDDDIEILFQWLKSDNPDVSVHFDLEEQRFILVCRMTNQFGNRVEMVVKSNTDRIDAVFSAIDETMESLDSLVLCIGTDRRLSGTNKLIFTARFEAKGEKRNDNSNAAEALRQED